MIEKSPLTIRTPEEVFSNGISVSMVKLWNLCKRRWYNRYVLGMKPPKTPDEQFGIAGHKFLDAYYHRKPGLHYDQFKVDFPLELNTDKRTQELGIRLLKEYVNTHRLETEPFQLYPIDPTKYPQTEMGGYRIDHLHIVPDALVTYQNGVWILEHKFPTRLGATYFEKFRNDYQGYVYIYGMSKLLSIKIEGLLVNAIGCKQKVDNDNFLRKAFYYTAEQVEYHVKQFMSIVGEMISFTEENYEHPFRFSMTSDSTACQSYNVSCPFLTSCELNGNLKVLENMIANE